MSSNKVTYFGLFFAAWFFDVALSWFRYFLPPLKKLKASGQMRV